MRAALALLLAGGAAQAEPAPYRTDLPARPEGVETALPTFATCPDYLENFEAAQIEAETVPGGALDCEIAHLMSLAGPAEAPAPSACALVDAAVDRLDLRSFPNGARPRLPEGEAPVTLGDLYDVSFVTYCGGAVARGEGWQASVTPLAAGDWTGDGVLDGLVVMEEVSEEGSYHTISPLVLTGLDGDRVTGLPTCAFVELADRAAREACPPAR